ncbi:MAG: phosphoribosylamine--glycine ligase [Deltaproteobacteria bacterium]|nr:MAG: phosphoribosylamine--glycine ligase [Pseudomonadota bacterium]PIE66342.1 MAG: phosphoribosylamine--glycine ligase [Deltaproteobacteria bacterium]
MKVLVIGSGGREHVLCWSLAKSPQLTRLFCAPGNPGTAEVAENVEIAADDLDGLLSWARAQGIDLTVVGPEAPLCAGLADRFIEAGLAVAGPSAAAARLEGSKAWAKRFMARHDIPTAPFELVSDVEAADRYLETNPKARVIKLDGLAGGKGVVVADDLASAKAAVRDLSPRGELVIEERLRGEEVSVIALADGERVLMLASSQDHKAAFDGDTGPNTGGMGAYSPAPMLDAVLAGEVQRRVLEPTIAGLAADGIPFRGILYAGLMIVDGEPQVLEYNCRFGDPEAQTLLPRLASDLLPLLAGAAAGELPREDLCWDPRPALCVVLASGGYPGKSPTGLPIEGVAAVNAAAGDELMVFHAGTALVDERLVTAGGRVLAVTALGDDLGAARARAYAACERITWPERRFRRDIGHRALRRNADAPR